MNKKYGSYLTLVDIANTGLFGTTIYEVAEAKLYDTFAHLDAIAAREYYNKLNQK